MTTDFIINAHGHEFDLHLDGFPAELEGVASELMDTLGGIVPPWCRTLTLIFAEPQNNGSAAEADVNHRYRFAMITLGAVFFNQDESHRVRYLLHELLHIATAPACEAADSIIGDLTEDLPPSAQRTCKSRFSDAEEQTVQDLTYALLPLFTKNA